MRESVSEGVCLWQGMDSVLLLVSFGADVNAMTDARHDFRTVLHYAVLSGCAATVNLLLKQGARVTFPPDYQQPTPLHLAVLRGDPELVRMLIKAGKTSQIARAFFVHGMRAGVLRAEVKLSINSFLCDQN